MTLSLTLDGLPAQSDVMETVCATNDGFFLDVVDNCKMDVLGMPPGVSGIVLVAIVAAIAAAFRNRGN